MAYQFTAIGETFSGVSNDEETGRGFALLKLLQYNDIKNIAVCITRKYGGTPLHNKRFTHIRTTTLQAITSLLPGFQPKNHRMDTEKAPDDTEVFT